MSIPRMNYRQYRKARKLTHECCNYCDGNCLLLDDGEECVCVQSISYSLLCRWFRAAVLPLDADAPEVVVKQHGTVAQHLQRVNLHRAVRFHLPLLHGYVVVGAKPASNQSVSTPSL